MTPLSTVLHNYCTDINAVSFDSHLSVCRRPLQNRTRGSRGPERTETEVIAEIFQRLATETSQGDEWTKPGKRQKLRSAHIRAVETKQLSSSRNLLKEVMDNPSASRSSEVRMKAAVSPCRSCRRWPRGIERRSDSVLPHAWRSSRTKRKQESVGRRSQRRHKKIR